MVPRPFPGRPAVPLLKKLFLQLDKSAKDNKNRYVMAFCSLLTASRIFKEVAIGFLIVGHTHEDIDAHFSYLLKLLKMKNMYVLSNLMKAFIDSQKTTAFIPEVVQEVVDFKKFLQGYQHDGPTVLISSSDLEKCISLSSMLRRKATIWVGQSCITMFIFRFCLSDSVFVLNGCTSLQTPSLCYFVDVGGLLIHPCPKSLLVALYPEACYQSILAAPWPDCLNVVLER